MMRFGRLLAEGSPADLLDRYSMPNLEDVFLNLCLSDDVDEEGKQKSPEKGEHDCKVVTVSPSKDRKQSTVSNRSNVSNAKSGKGSNTFVKWHRLSALLVKGFLLHHQTSQDRELRMICPRSNLRRSSSEPKSIL